VCRRCPCSLTSTDRRPRPLVVDIERSRTSVITGYRPGSPDPCATRRRFCVEQACWRPSSLDPLAPPSPGCTLHHESPDPPGDPISAPEANVIHGRADATRRAALRARSASCSPPTRRTTLLGGSPSNPWEGHHRKMCSALCSDGSPSPVATTDGDVDPPLLPRTTMTATASGDQSSMT
jgi:hypothetical protein